MKVPLGFSNGQAGLVCRLRSICMVLNRLLGFGFLSCLKLLPKWIPPVSIDYSLFTYHASNVFFCVRVYVDDLIISGNVFASILGFKKHLNLFSYVGFRSFKIFLGH